MNQTPDLSFVQKPGAHTRLAERLDPGQIDSALTKRVQHRGRVVRADQADASNAGTPEGCAQRSVHDGAAGLPHAGAAVREHDVIHEEIAEQDESGRHLGATAASRRLAPWTPPPCDPLGCSTARPVSVMIPR